MKDFFAPDNLSALGYLAGWRFVRVLPLPIARGIFNFGADRASKSGKGMGQLRANLARVVGPENVTQSLVKQAMRSYARYWLEAFRLPTTSKDPQLFAQLHQGVVGLDMLDASLGKGKGVILTLPHSGNWDMAGTFLVGYHGQFITVAERVKPERLFEAFVAFRESLGFEVLPLTGGQRPPFEKLKETLMQGGIVCLLGERDLRHSGVETVFFGEKTSMPAGPAQLALETGAALHVVHSWFEDDGDSGWGLSVSDAVDVDNLSDTVQRIADLFAANIAAHPADWHMLQPLWFGDLDPQRLQRAKHAGELGISEEEK
ncbi:phosphatidylinositol mannoside acyltransferase [Corynebacterium crudilactis]|uniref:Phosphatidylinositol mannoside acyltransferase n=1 Tax=Corynebacterium crudilactis TaxID=1652495 RepID=A0A172QTY3_9CORY|nr:phosphatidylinositol mannoside acyltransferase [Corynebacterium crudilactis]ANE04167.1 phosphatidylinositol mannoside acyltransferase [Corynebacterium crudilactis]